MNGKEFYYSYDRFGNLTCIRYYLNGVAEDNLYVVCNSRGDVEALYGGSGTLVARYIYDSWGNTLSVQNANGNAITSSTHIANLNRIRYRGYYWDAETSLYYLQSRYYDPVTCRFVNADGQLNPGILGYNTFAYCGNNPVKNYDPNGRLFFGALVGGIVGGAMGALNAYINGKSIKSGCITGAITGATIGAVCDAVATGGMSLGVGVLICGAAAGVGNIINQSCNYVSEKESQIKTDSGNNIPKTSDKKQIKLPIQYDGKLAVECKSFIEYLDVKSVVKSSVTAMAFAPVSIGANCIVNSAFVGCDNSGIIGFIAQFGANFALGGNLSILQSIIDLF